MNQKLIVIDGKTYKSVDEMPEDVRRNYENAMRNLDKNQNGLPDMLENMNLFADEKKAGMPNAFTGLVSNVISSTKIIADGKTYNSLDELPPAIRAKYDQAMSSMDSNHNGVPDFMEGLTNISNQQTNNVAVSFGASTLAPASRQPTPVNSTIEPESSSNWLMAIAGVLLIGLCLAAAAAGVWYYFLR